MVIHGVIELGITDSVKEVPFFFERMTYVIGGREYALNDIEHGRRQGVEDPLRLGDLQMVPGGFSVGPARTGAVYRRLSLRYRDGRMAHGKRRPDHPGLHPL
jgi:hypothetical protein